MLSYCALYDCITIPTIFQNSPQKSSGKGSLLLPCPKMPIGIFLFSLKSEFKKVRKRAKNEENPRKSRVFRLASFLSTRLGDATQSIRRWRISLTLPSVGKPPPRCGEDVNRAPCRGTAPDSRKEWRLHMHKKEHPLWDAAKRKFRKTDATQIFAGGEYLQP